MINNIIITSSFYNLITGIMDSLLNRPVCNRL
jgi:hypothetical protein